MAGSRTTAGWEQLCGEHSIPFAPVLELEDAEDDPYITDGGVLSTQQHPTEGGYRSIGFPVRLSATPGGLRTHCPTLGQDSAELLRELGRSDDQIAAMAASGTAVLSGPATETQEVPA